MRCDVCKKEVMKLIPVEVQRRSDSKPIEGKLCKECFKVLHSSTVELGIWGLTYPQGVLE